MSKGGYHGGSTVVGFGGAFAGSPSIKLTRATDVDAHLSQKGKRDQARKLATGKKVKAKVSKAQKTAEKRQREEYKKADKTVVVEHRRAGEIVATRTIKRS